MKHIKYTKELLEPLVKNSITYAEVLGKLNLKRAGGNYLNLIKNIEKFDISVTHMTHKSVCLGQEIKKFEDLSGKTQIKKRLLKMRGHKCEGDDCGLTTWKGQLICLEVDHVDGNNRNNDETNLKLLCPNCHSQTPTWRNRKRV